MENLVREQRNLAGEMMSSYNSYVKNPSRKSIPAIKNRLAKLKDLWQYFEQNDSNLVDNLIPDHEYFINKEYQQTKTSYLQTIQRLESDLADLEKQGNLDGESNLDNTVLENVPDLTVPSLALQIPVTTLESANVLGATQQTSPNYSGWDNTSIIQTPWSNIGIWPSTTIAAPTDPWMSMTTAPVNPMSSTMMTTTKTIGSPTIITQSTNSWSSPAVPSNTATSTTMATITNPNTYATSATTSTWSAYPNPQLACTNPHMSIPNQQFLMQNPHMFIPNQQFMMQNPHMFIPNQRFTMQNPHTMPNNTSGFLNNSQLYNLPKLQPLTIPTFDGCTKKWAAFSDLFKTIIHNNIALQNIQKMQYLIGYLDGEPARIIQHLNLSDNNYLTAINLLRDRYDNPRKILDTYITTILDLKRVESRSAKDIILLADTLKECLAAIANLNYNTQHWDPIIITIAMKKLDYESIRLFEESLPNQKVMPALPDLYRFLERRYQVLETTKKDIKNPKDNSKKVLMVTTSATTTALNKNTPTCKMCKEDHKIQHCEKFKQLTTKERSAWVDKTKVCSNCLQHDKSMKCKSKRSCQHCSKKHHSLLHHDHQTKNTPDNKTSTGSTVANIAAIPVPTTINMISRSQKTFVLLATALIRVKTIFDEWELMRIVIDLGSQGTFITENAAQKLGLPKQRYVTPLKALGDTSAGNSMTKIDFEIRPRFESNFSLRVSDAIILKKIVQDLPGKEITKLTHKRYCNLLLADPNYYVNGPIDILINAEVFGQILKNGLVKGKPTAQNTELGWILFGAIPDIPSSEQSALATISMISMAEIEENMRRFWQIEKSSTSQTSDEFCEQHYRKTHSRDKDGRYIVRLPFKEQKTLIGDNRAKAVMRFYNIEKKMKKNDHDFGTTYDKFVQEYYNLGHMKEVEEEVNSKGVYYLPHHAVTPRTKFRVVFDGSCKPKNGLSLNEALHTGPKLQQSLVEIINRWRTYKYVLTADIEKMFRQIKMHEKDQPYQRIFYRSRPDVPLQEFQLLTVTYGTACATFLSVRTLLQLAEDEGDKFPKGRTILLRDLYVDDMMTGSHTLDNASECQQQVNELTKLGGFNLRKWASNDKRLLQNVPVESRAKETQEIKDDESIKTLGIHWSPMKDEFSFKIRAEVLTERQLTKREFLSIISSIYDPIGWLSPFTVKTKIMMQKLWEPETNWDDKISPQVQKEWNKICNEIKNIEKFFIPRWIHYQPKVETQIHGFCDASADAYSAVLYSRTIVDKKVIVTLLAAKTRVTPLKMDKNKNTTIPRLELSGALLLAELLQETLEKSNIEVASLHTWSDSTTTLNWIYRNSSNDRFISNRTKLIISLTDPKIWKYVPGEENPADCASRGIYPKQLLEHKLWWHGPDWLSLDEQYWPKFEIKEPASIMLPGKISLTATITNQWLTITKTGKVWNLLTAYSDFSKLTRIVAYCRRFLKNVSKSHKKTGFLTPEELNSAKTIIYKQIQKANFPQEHRDLQMKKPIQRTSKLLPLSPFIDELGLIRVGGRLKNSDWSSSRKHPIILPKNYFITDIIIRQAHCETMHGGQQLTAAHLLEQFWILSSSRMIKSIIRKCITCFKQAPKTSEQIMANLPRDRVIQSPPFSHSGVDYTGEFHVRVSKGRGTKTYKAYVCLFVCMATKAIHLELASDLTADAFLAAYKRFTGRRGYPKEIFSDNGGNFVSGNKKLEKQLQAAIKEATETAAALTAKDGTNWHFNPPRSAHFGGLFEAGIKSIKKHLKAVLGDTKLTFEEFTTVLAQVEACVNSRPLTPLSNDPNDLEALTPGHFLIGRPILNPPEADQTKYKAVSNRWNLLTKLKQDIWKRWSKEYLNTLQKRQKWREERENLKIGDLVLIHEDHIPPTRWPLGRIQEVVKGDDDKVRVIDIRCKARLDKEGNIIHQTLTRAISKVCPLPSDKEDNQSASDAGVNNEPLDPISSSKVDEEKVNLITTISQDKSYTYNNKLERILNSKPKKRDHKHLDNLVQRFKSVSQQTKKRKIQITPVFWCTIILIFGLGYGDNKFENKKLEHGIYIETTGHCQLLKGTLRLESSINYAELSQDEWNIDDVLNKTKNLCTTTGQVRDETQCETLIRHFKQRAQDLLDDIKRIKGIFSSRHKRGLLGKLLQGVFGVNDQVYTDLNDLNTNQQILRNVMAQQNLQVGLKLNQTYDKVNQRLTNFNEKLNEVIDKINEMDQWFTSVDTNTIAIRLLSTYMAAGNYIDEIQAKYNKLIKILLDHGNFLDIVDITTLQQTIEFANTKLPSNMVISMIPQRQMRQSKINETLKMFGFLDIVGISKYEILHITPIPKSIGNKTFVSPVIPFTTIAVNYNDQTYFYLSSEELNKCTSRGEQLLLCNPSIISNLESNPNCVIDEIYDRHSKQKCELIKFTMDNVLWKQLIKRNTWLYVAAKETNIAIICQGERVDLQIQGVGVIKINNGCTIKTERNSLLFHTTFQQDIHLTLMKPTNFSIQEYDKLDKSTKIDEIEPIIASKDTLSTYIQPSTKQLVDLHKNTDNHTRVTTLVIILIIIICVASIIYIRTQLYKLICGARFQETAV